jgi:hypothetical protein
VARLRCVKENPSRWAQWHVVSAGYRFADFVRVGAPLTVPATVVVVFLAPMLWRG